MAMDETPKHDKTELAFHSEVPSLGELRFQKILLETLQCLCLAFQRGPMFLVLTDLRAVNSALDQQSLAGDGGTAGAAESGTEPPADVVESSAAVAGTSAVAAAGPPAAAVESSADGAESAAVAVGAGEADVAAHQTLQGTGPGLYFVHVTDWEVVAGHSAGVAEFEFGGVFLVVEWASTAVSWVLV